MKQPETAEDSLRQERRQFTRAWVFTAFAFTIYVGVTIFVRLNAGKIIGMTAAGASPQEIYQREWVSMIALEFGGLGILLCVLVLVRSLVKWLLAIRRRRRAGSGLPPPALP